MYDFTLSIEIAAPPARVWRALCDPAEVVLWDRSLERALDAPPDYPWPGQHVRWRLRSGFFRLLHDRPLEVEPERRLRSLLALGPLRYDETYTIVATDAGCRLSARLAAWTALPLLGTVSERVYGAAAARAALEAALDALRQLCEGSAT